MLTFLADFAQSFGPLNVFRYITFRAGGATVTALLIVFMFGPKIIDASTAHRTAAGWVFGFPELAPGQKAAVQGARRVSNPGCYATGAIALVPVGTVTAVNLSTWILIVHGWLYVVYLFGCFQLWSAMRWSALWFPVLAAGGVVPFLSFFTERRVRRIVEEATR